MIVGKRHIRILAASASLLLAFATSVWAEPVNVRLATSTGVIRMELYPDKAPITVANFLKYIDAEAFDEGRFYRVVRMDNQEQNTIKIEVIQGGLMIGDAPPSFPPIPLERTNATGLKHVHGAVSMARSVPDSGTSEFFICINDQPSLDYGGQRNPDGQGFAAFGHVIEGMDVVLRIQGMETDTPDPNNLQYTSGQSLLEPVRFISFERE